MGFSFADSGFVVAGKIRWTEYKLSAVAIGIGALAGGCASFVARRINVYCRHRLSNGTTLAELIQEYRGLLAESDWPTFYRKYQRLLRSSAVYAMARLLTATMAVIPVLLLYCAAAMIWQAWGARAEERHWLSAGDWSFLLTATLATVVAPWLRGGRN